MCDIDKLTVEEFDKLTKKQQCTLVSKALAWFCVFDSLNPLLRYANDVEIDTIKIVLGKFK